MPIDETKPSSEPQPTEYEISLNDDDLKELGRFTAVFSQIDFLLNEAISMTTKTPWWAMALMLENSTTGPKLNILRKALSEIKDKEAKRLASDACTRLSSLLDKRNHVIHGLWARHSVTAQKAVRTACFFNKYKESPVFPEDLRKLSDKGAKITRLLGDLLTRLSPQPPAAWTKPRSLLIMDRDTSELGWLLGGVELSAMGYPNPGDRLQVPPQPPKPSRA